jgi:hypothetical protein
VKDEEKGAFTGTHVKSAGTNSLSVSATYLDTPGDSVATTERWPQMVRWTPPIAMRSPRGFHDRHFGGAPSDGNVATWCQRYGKGPP